jgi:hypothetical protein
MDKNETLEAVLLICPLYHCVAEKRGVFWSPHSCLERSNWKDLSIVTTRGWYVTDQSPQFCCDPFCAHQRTMFPLSDVNSTTQNGRTAIFLAACNGQVAAVRALIQANADVNKAHCTCSRHTQQILF